MPEIQNISDVKEALKKVHGMIFSHDIDDERDRVMFFLLKPWRAPGEIVRILAEIRLFVEPKRIKILSNIICDICRMSYKSEKYFDDEDIVRVKLTSRDDIDWIILD